MGEAAAMTQPPGKYVVKSSAPRADQPEGVKMTFTYFVSYCFKNWDGHGYAHSTILLDHLITPDDLRKVVDSLRASANYSSVAILNFILYPTVQE